ncbi:hypothetical protein D6745_01580 [Candidatus Woesearchaeota archaeon]|nr:MAG: hypothetical protein D6745_01580 [Candidatus Woesearchaeota archaeon]
MLVPLTFTSINLGCSDDEIIIDNWENKHKKPVKLRVGIYSDPHAGYDGSQEFQPSEVYHRRVIDNLLRESPDMVICMGDQVHNLGTNQWSKFDEITSDLRSKIPFYPLIGNHDSFVGLEKYLDFFDGYIPQNGNGNYYYIEDPLALFVCMDVHSNVRLSQDQENWIKQTLDTKSKRFNFLVLHYPPYTTAGRGPYQNVKESINSLLNSYDITAVLSGHIHAYERFVIQTQDNNERNFIVAGGGGGFGCSSTKPNGAHCLDANAETNYLKQLRVAKSQEHHFMIMSITEDSCSISVYDYTMQRIIDTVFLKPSRILL